MSYQTLAGELSSSTHGGHHAPGMRCPSVRLATKSWGTSRAPACGTYRRLRSERNFGTPRVEPFLVGEPLLRVLLTGWESIRQPHMKSATDDLLRHGRSASSRAIQAVDGCASPPPAMSSFCGLHRFLTCIVRTSGTQSGLSRSSVDRADVRWQIFPMASELTLPDGELAVLNCPQGWIVVGPFGCANRQTEVGDRAPAPTRAQQLIAEFLHNNRFRYSSANGPLKHRVVLADPKKLARLARSRRYRLLPRPVRLIDRNRVPHYKPYPLETRRTDIALRSCRAAGPI
jgi:hypothetical protein